MLNIDRVRDGKLVERLRAGDGTAASELWGRHGPRIQQLAFRLMKSREDAEEVAQDVLMKVVQKIAAFRGDAALSSWIYRITFNTAMSRLRNPRFARPAEVAERAGGEDHRRGRREPADWSRMSDETLLRSQLRARLADALEQLPSIYREPVVLRDLEGLSTLEASRRLRVKTQTLKSRLHRGRLLLRDRLSDFSDGITLHRAA
jgi:RNA polymerase sigma-70 factor, ECF subfamily